MSGVAARALFAVMICPGVMAGVVPWLLVRASSPVRTFDPMALVLLGPGLALLAWCVVAFFTRGRGTLAPWDPPVHLVTSGPYTVSRNPMYVAVAMVLWAWAAGYRSAPLAVYAAAFMALVHLRVVFGEEPWLADRYGDEWTRYRRRVPRWLGLPRRIQDEGGRRTDI